MLSNRTALARAVCASCSVAGRCLVEALAEEAGWWPPDRHYIRGGLTAPQRAELAAGHESGADALIRFGRLRAEAATA